MDPFGADPIKIGLIVLQADETLEADVRLLFPPEVQYLVSRVPSGQEVTPHSLRQMADNLTAAAALFPRGANLAAVGYGCTSGTAEIGAHRIADLVGQGVTTPFVTEPVSALIAACRALGVARLGLVNPYIASVSDRLCEVLSAAGIDVTALASFDEPEEAKVARIPAAQIAAAAIEVGQNPACDAVFLSCTNLRTLGVVGTTEAKLGKPVLSSNQVLAWHLCHLAGVEPRLAKGTALSATKV